LSINILRIILLVRRFLRFTLVLLLIKVDIGGHPPIPQARKTIFHLGNVLAVFMVPNFWGCFEALNNVFWGFRAHMNTKGTYLG
jgi:hypothetical protein